MIDYKYKAEVLASGLPKLQGKISYAIFCNGSKEFDLDTAMKIDADMMAMCKSDWLESAKINHAKYHRVKRLKDRIQAMLVAGKCNFLTLTFNDDILANTSAETRRKYIRRYLKAYNCKYVANIDYGAKNGREHYHALILTDKVNYDLWHKYGAIKGKVVHTSDTDTNTRLAKYIAKLTNHAIKETTKANYMIYSRV